MGIEENDMLCYFRAVLAMKNKILLCVFLPWISYAGALGDVCTDLARLTSAPGVYVDGTGKDGKGMARNSDSLVDFAVQIEGKFRPALVKRFKDILTDSAFAFFAQTAINSLRFDCDPACTRAYHHQTWTDPLLENVSQALAGLVFERILPQGMYAGTQSGRSRRSNKIEYKEIDFLLNNRVFIQERDRVRSEILQHFGLAESSTLIEESWKKVVPIFTDLVSDVVNQDFKVAALRKIRDIRLTHTDNCAPRSPYGEDRSNLESDMIANAFYDPISNTVSYCTGLIILNQSEFGIAFVLAHELAHAIDPCNIAVGPGDRRFVYKNLMDPAAAQDEYPVPGLISCLRSAQSVAASRKNFKLPDAVLTGGSEGSEEDAQTPPPSSAKYSVFCSKDGPTASDQISEATADWYASEVLARYIDAHWPRLTRDQYIYGYSNVFRGLYANTGDEIHPLMNDRINRILLVQPQVRQDMECPELGKIPIDPAYCAVPRSK